jgi:hypothetical protein
VVPAALAILSPVFFRVRENPPGKRMPPGPGAAPEKQATFCVARSAKDQQAPLPDGTLKESVGRRKRLPHKSANDSRTNVRIRRRAS